MQNLSLRNILIMVIGVAAVLIVLGVLIQALTGIMLPLLIGLGTGLVLGRYSHRIHLWKMVRGFATKSSLSAARGMASSVASTVTGAIEGAVDSALEKTTAPDVATEKKAAEAPAESRLEDAPPAEDEITDFEVKTPEELNAEMRRLEDRVSKQSAGYDAQQALEERKRRLLGDQADAE